MKERPILFSAPMVRAILEGRKTQTRRVVKPAWSIYPASDPRMTKWSPPSPYGRPGDRLWVREAWRHIDGGAVYDAAGGIMDSHDPETIYRASEPSWRWPWKSPIYMPRWASRILLEIVSIHVERLNEISEGDSIAEGAEWAACGSPQEGSHKAGYARLWESINGPGSWEANPWVWVIEFQRVQP